MNERRRKMALRRRKRALVIQLFYFLLIAVLSGMCIWGFLKFKHTHFRKNTTISGVDCSGLNITQTQEKLNMFVSDSTINLIFSEEHTYSYEALAVNLELSTQDLQDILDKQNKGDKQRAFSPNIYSFDEQVLENILQECFKKHFSLSDDILLDIYENEINFEKTFAIVSDNLQKGNFNIDLSSLVPLKDFAKIKLNKILSTKIKFCLANDTIITLDNSIMKNWLVKDEIDIDSNLPVFIESLADEASKASSFLLFDATDVGSVAVPVSEKYRAVIGQEKELEQLKSEILSGATVTRSPIYTAVPISLDNVSSYIELDLSNQRVLMYDNGKLVLDTPCVTGNVSGGNSTPTGLYYLTYKTTNAYLKGYNNDGTPYKSHVNYWMPFNGNIGFHDASWRKGQFGGTIYLKNGSHGCVNLPLESAKTIYQHIDKNMPIIVYESEQ